MGDTISEAIGKDHHAFDVYYDNIKATDDPAEKARWRNQLTWIVARHAISEELTWYPAMEKYLGDEGKRLSATDKEQHAGVEAQLTKLEAMSPTLSEFQPTLDTLMAHLHEHIEHEKNEDMPRLEKVLPPGVSQELARSFQRTKVIVPTHPHTAAPKSYYFETLAALLAAPLDRFYDLIARDFPNAEDVKNADKNVGREEGQEPVAMGQFLKDKL